MDTDMGQHLVVWLHLCSINSYFASIKGICPNLNSGEVQLDLLTHVHPKWAMIKCRVETFPLQSHMEATTQPHRFSTHVYLSQTNYQCKLYCNNYRDKWKSSSSDTISKWLQWPESFTRRPLTRFSFFHCDEWVQCTSEKIMGSLCLLSVTAIMMVIKAQTYLTFCTLWGVIVIVIPKRKVPVKIMELLVFQQTQ